MCKFEGTYKAYILKFIAVETSSTKMLSLTVTVRVYVLFACSPVSNVSVIIRLLPVYVDW